MFEKKFTEAEVASLLEQQAIRFTKELQQLRSEMVTEISKAESRVRAMQSYGTTSYTLNNGTTISLADIISQVVQALTEDFQRLVADRLATIDFSQLGEDLYNDISSEDVIEKLVAQIRFQEMVHGDIDRQELISALVEYLVDNVIDTSSLETDIVNSFSRRFRIVLD